jgi:hypothetical protein
MIKEAFSIMAHDHYFEGVNGMAQVKDSFELKAPLGVFGLIAEKVFLTRYMRCFLIERNLVLQSLAESDDWKRFLQV